MTTHLWTNVPPARDFVRKSRPDVKTLDYEPLTGTDPNRPKARDPANISALRAELQGDAARNEQKARALRPASKPRTKQAAAPRS